jgi:hypothetical protein
MLVLGVLQTHDVVVDVAVNSPKRLKGFELFSGFNISNVTGMPNLVNILEKVKDLWNDDAMGVR